MLIFVSQKYKHIMSKGVYIHGFSDEEQQRLIDQNETLAKYIYANIDLSKHQRVLEIGCGVGAQMMYMIDRFPDIHVTGLELSQSQIDKAQYFMEQSGVPRDKFDLVQGDATAFPDDLELNFDAVVMVWVLEHIDKPLQVFLEVKDKLPQGTILYVTEVFHRSFNIHPYSPSIDQFWTTMMVFQEENGGDANIGLKLGAYMDQSGIEVLSCKPFPMHFDRRLPGQRKEMQVYWLELMRSAVPEMRSAGVLDETVWKVAESDMLSAIDNPESVFYYSFIQAFGKV